MGELHPKQFRNITRDNKWRQFYFKLLHRILVTYNERKRFGITDCDKCVMCGENHSIEHAFFECQSFLNLTSLFNGSVANTKLTSAHLATTLSKFTNTNHQSFRQTDKGFVSSSVICKTVPLLLQNNAKESSRLFWIHIQIYYPAWNR